MGLHPYHLEDVTLSFIAQGPEIAIRDLEGRFYGGRLEGNANFYPTRGMSNFQFEVAGRMQDVDLSRLLSAVQQRPVEQFSGLVSSVFAVNGELGDATRHSYVGQGRVSIRKGVLNQFPVFGIFSQLLTKLYPGLGYIRQTELDTAFRLRDGRVSMDELRLNGTLFSVRAHGSVTLEHDLDFRVQLQLLRGGLLADLVRFVTSPLTKIFEFHLGGRSFFPWTEQPVVTGLKSL